MRFHLQSMIAITFHKLTWTRWASDALVRGKTFLDPLCLNQIPFIITATATVTATLTPIVEQFTTEREKLPEAARPLCHGVANLQRHCQGSFSAGEGTPWQLMEESLKQPLSDAHNLVFERSPTAELKEVALGLRPE